MALLYYTVSSDATSAAPIWASNPDDVREEVKRRIEVLGPGGGYVCTSVHNIQKEVPPENICAMLEAAREFGVYN